MQEGSSGECPVLRFDRASGGVCRVIAEARLAAY